jgi:hypothetical protein
VDMLSNVAVRAVPLGATAWLRLRGWRVTLY